MNAANRVAWALTLVALAAGFSCSDGSDFIFDPSPTVFGSGTIVQETRTVSGATGLNLAGFAQVTLQQGAPERIELETDDNLMSRILTELQGGVLVIRSDPTVTLQPSQRPEARVWLSDVDTIMLTGVGEISVPALTTGQLDLSLSGVGKIVVSNLAAQSLSVVNSGIDDVRVDGLVDDQQIRLTGMGDYEAANLASATADVMISGSGSATIRVSTALNVTITGSGSVFYHGSPVVSSTVTGTGSVAQLSP